MATVEEQNAAFDVINLRLHALLGELPSIPFVDLAGRARAFLDSPKGRKAVLDGVREGLEAAEKVRAEKK